MSDKSVNLDHLRMVAEQSAGMSAQVAAAAAAAIEELDEKINSLKTSVSDGKSAIASAITDKGVSTSATAEFSIMASSIGRIQTGADTSDATAAAADMLSGETAYVKGAEAAGTYGASESVVAVSKNASIRSYSIIYPSPESKFSAEDNITTAKSFTTFGVFYLKAVVSDISSQNRAQISVSGGTYVDLTSSLDGGAAYLILPASSTVTVDLSVGT